MSEKITLRKLDGVWVLRAAGAIIAETTNAIELSEDGYTDVIYFPREDIAMAFLDVSQKTTHCPHKGDATYFDIQTKNGPIQNAGWSYEIPKAHVAEIAEHIAFAPHEKLAVEKL